MYIPSPDPTSSNRAMKIVIASLHMLDLHAWHKDAGRFASTVACGSAEECVTPFNPASFDCVSAILASSFAASLADASSAPSFAWLSQKRRDAVDCHIVQPLVDPIDAGFGGHSVPPGLSQPDGAPEPSQAELGASQVGSQILVGLNLSGTLARGISPVQRGMAQGRRQRISRDDKPDQSRSEPLGTTFGFDCSKDQKRHQCLQAICGCTRRSIKSLSNSETPS